MKFYEIPAAGGFQICDWQPLMNSTDLGKQTVACRSPREFAQQVHYYLAHEQERQKIMAANTQTAFSTTDYQTRLDDLLEQMTVRSKSSDQTVNNL